MITVVSIVWTASPFSGRARDSQPSSFITNSDVNIAHRNVRHNGTLVIFFTFMYIIIYIVNYNEYIVMYNIESHSLTITSTT